MREAGLVEALRATGLEVVDAGDLTMRRWRPDPSHPFAQNVDEEARATAELAGAAGRLLGEGRRLLVLGGSCVVAVGMCAGMRIAGARPQLVYVDRHLDLNTPSSTAEGSLSWMGMAHALGLEGAAPELVDATGRTPVLSPRDLVYLGADPTNETTQWERDRIDELGIEVVDQAAMCADPAHAAARARAHLTDEPFVVHLDVDVLDFLDAPIAENVNGRNSGPTISVLGRSLAVLIGDPQCWGLSIGQLDPNHAISDPTALPRLIATLGAALTPAPSADGELTT
ncbi:hypothetical protein GCM10009846_13740 [Agrococcus versicolor]|uniref:Arginase n=2 Tax=Agrococcus versicolor TaxID=501482 RepID=A0ABN3AQ75_9MICO